MLSTPSKYFRCNLARSMGGSSTKHSSCHYDCFRYLASKLNSTLGGTGRYGSEGSVRPDISLENDAGDTLAYYDYKTGGATVSSRYADKVRSADGGSSVPVIQLSVTSGIRIKSWKHPRFD